MTYKRLGAAGERLNAGDLNELISKFHMKAKVCYSNKHTLPNEDIFINVRGNIIHFLLESVERVSTYRTGQAMTYPEDWSNGSSLPSNIKEPNIYIANGAIPPFTVVNKSDNISNPTSIGIEDYGDYSVEYFYTFFSITLDLSDVDPNGYYTISGFESTTGGTAVIPDSGTLRVSYGTTSVTNTPLAIQNKELDLNMSFAVSEAFNFNPILLFQAGSEGKYTWTIKLDEIFIPQNITNFKLVVMNDNATLSGISIEEASPDRGGLTEVDHNIITVSGTRYIHELTFFYSPDKSENPPEYTGYIYYPATLRADSTYVYYGSLIILPNSANEFASGNPKIIQSISNGSPLTNILLSYMKTISEFSVYNYGPQNYTASEGADAIFANSVDNSKQLGLKDGKYNTHLTLAGAYYHLFDMTSFNDTDQVSWNIQYIK